MKRFCFALDLKNDEHLIKEYEAYHKNVWPEIIDGIKKVGITDMQIFRVSNRMFMIMETVPDFDYDKQIKLLGSLPKQKEWEELMWKYQQALIDGQKWVPMQQIFKL
ncbi:MAG: L-rhamnose mutarotase [Bacteroidota bacterium]|nr:L-rhamnose mutarotase [Bacteroidota bacterium]